MRRFATAGAVVVVGLATIVAAVGTWPMGTAALGQDGVSSGGIGLSRDDWEDLHGAGEAGQSLVSYEGGAYDVGFEEGVVAFVELGWEDVSNVTFDEAEVEDLLPSDAELVEAFAFPATAVGPTSLLARRYESEALADLFGGERTGGILVLYQEAPSPDCFEPDVSRASIAIGAGA